MPTLTAQDLAAIGITKGKAAPLLRACSELKAQAAKRGATGMDFVPRRISVQSGESGAAARPTPKPRPTSLSRPPAEPAPTRGMGSGRTHGSMRSSSVSSSQGAARDEDDAGGGASRSGRSYSDSEPLYENVSFCRDAGGNMQAVIDGVALPSNALQ